MALGKVGRPRVNPRVPRGYSVEEMRSFRGYIYHFHMNDKGAWLFTKKPLMYNQLKELRMGVMPTIPDHTFIYIRFRSLRTVKVLAEGFKQNHFYKNKKYYHQFKGWGCIVFKKEGREPANRQLCSEYARILTNASLNGGF